MSNESKVKIKRVQLDQSSDESATKAEVKPATMINPAQKRVFSDLREITTDLYKLMQAPLLKNISIKKDHETDPAANPTDFITAEHCHFFRTKDSDGKVHKRCMPVANHYHNVEYQTDPNDPDGAPIITSVSAPMRLAKKRVGGKLVDVDVPLNSYDFHTHDVLYVKSENIKIRAGNVAAAQFMAQELQKGAPVPGVGER
jgi:hypothetical protein